MEKLLRQQDIAAMFGTTPGVAASILAGHGVQPIDFGIGRGRGRRWLESAVRQVMLDMHEAAQPKAKKERQGKVQAGPVLKLSTMSINDIYQLTQGQSVQ